MAKQAKLHRSDQRPESYTSLNSSSATVKPQLYVFSSVIVRAWNATHKTSIGMTIKAPASARSPVGYGPLKSRRGCKTCKARRVKCGEEKPFCLRCTSTGRHCEYAGTTYGTFSSASSATTSAIETTLARSPSPTSTRAWRERRAFAYYSQHAAPILGGLDVEFWSTIVPRICHSEPAVWDAIISISSLFESYKPSNPVHKYRDALGWYSRSVSAVRQQIERGGADVFVGLISCVLFICIEALQGGTQEALRLYSQGTHLALALREQIASGVVPATKGSLLEETIVPIFARLSVLANSESKAAVNVLLRGTDRLLMPGFIFPSLKAAREAIFVLMAETQLFQEACEKHHDTTNEYNVPDHMISQQMAILSRLRTWHGAFTALTTSLRHRETPLSPQQTKTIALLYTHHEMLYIITSTCVSRFKTTTDTCLPNFQTIVEQSRIALDASNRPDGTQPPFTFDIGVGFPLWFAVLRCAEPLTRREAITLLKRAPQVQGFYARTFGVNFAQAVVDVEEAFAKSMAVSIEMDIGMAAVAATTAPKTLSQSPSVICLGSPCNSGRVSINSTSRSVSSSSSPPPTPANLKIPEEARIKPYGIFLPRNGIPPGTNEEDVAKWNLSPNQPFLQYSRNLIDPVTGVWRVVHEVIPITIDT